MTAREWYGIGAAHAGLMVAGIGIGAWVFSDGGWPDVARTVAIFAVLDPIALIATRAAVRRLVKP